MPILTSRPKRPTRKETLDTPKKPVIAEPTYKGNSVDTRYEPRKSLLTHIEGMPWVVTFYQQLIGKDNELSPQQMGRDPVYQQYRKISELEIRVTSELSQSQMESGSFEVNGSAVLYPPMKPNKGDMFLADIGDGREGVFSVIRSERLSIMREACYQIDYVLVSHSTDERRQDLDSKTIQSTHFVKRLLEHGEDPVVVDEQYRQYLSLQQYWERLLGTYMSRFYSKSASTILVPNQTYPTYDPFVTKFLSSFISSSEHPLLRHMKKYSVDLPNRNLPWTLWEALLKVSDAILPMVEEHVSLVPSFAFGVLPQYESVHYSNIRWVVYPHNPKDPLYPLEGLQSGQHPPKDLRHQFTSTELTTLEDTDGRVDIHPVTYDDYYVLSGAFYKGQDTQQSRLESLVQDVLTRRPIDRSTLVELCDRVHQWTLLEQYYFTPILLVMIKMVLRGQ